MSKGDDILTNQYIIELLDLMTLISKITTAQEADLLYRVMSFTWLNLDHLVVMKLGRVAGKLQVDLYDLIAKGLEIINQELVGQEITKEEFLTITAFLDKLSDFAKQDHALTFNHFFEKLITNDGFGFLNFIQNLPNSFEQIAMLNTLFAEIKAMLQKNHQLRLVDFLQQIEVYKNHQIKIQSKNSLAQSEAVYLSTVHSAKGMEWEHVFLINLLDKKWGNQRDHSKIKLPSGIIKNTDLSKKNAMKMMSSFLCRSQPC
jgi:superfamily I DNA/RNA helicase